MAIFPEEINEESVNKWKWMDFVMQCLIREGSQYFGGNINVFKIC